MTIVDFYHSMVKPEYSINDFVLFNYRTGFSIGFDKEGNLCVVIKSSNKQRGPIQQRTKLLSIECNRHLSYMHDGEDKEICVHIIKCFSQEEKEQELFLELIDATLVDVASDEEVMEVFRTLIDFFTQKGEPSGIELTGLYAELYTIQAFSNSLGIEKYWQSRDRMKFDFSFSDSLKLEIKATTKNTRTHHFLHEQLATEMYSIIVLSYMLRYDDQGESLYDLITRVKPLLHNCPNYLFRLNTILKNASDNRLKELKFSPEYTEDKRHFYHATNIPRFSETTPDGVANAEYDCDLENISYFDDEDFISIVKQELSKEE